MVETAGPKSKHVDGIKALPATGGILHLSFQLQMFALRIYIREDGALDSGHIKVISNDALSGYENEGSWKGKAKRCL